MIDVFSKDKRSEVMSKIRAQGNKETEIALAKLMRRHNIRGWRRHQPLYGTPDFTFLRHRVVVFVDGCFWHGCPRHGVMPSTNRDFWENKLKANRIRDRLVTSVLRQRGWYVLRLWEHDLTRKNQIRCIKRLKNILGVHKATP